MKYFKKLCSVFIAGLLAFSSVGCSSNESPKKSDENPGSVSEEPMKFDFISDIVDRINPDAYVFQELEKKYNIKFNFVSIPPDDGIQTISMMLSSGDAPDIFWDAKFSDFHSFIDQGILMEIPRSLIEEKAPKLTKWFNENAGEDAWKYYEHDGKNYAVPIIWTLGSTANALGIRYDLFKEAGYDKEPVTLDDLESGMKLVKEKFNMAPLTGDLEKVSFVFGAYGVYPKIFYADDNDQIQYGFISPDAKDALTVLSRWYQEGLLDPEFLINTPETIKEKWNASKVAVVQRPWYSLVPLDAFGNGSYYEPIMKENPNADIRVIPFPKGPDGKNGTVQFSPIGENSGLLFLSSLEDQPEKVAKYLEVFDDAFSQEVLDLTMGGLEGTTYSYSETEGFKWLPPYDDEKKRDEFGILGLPIPGPFNDYALQSKYKTLPSLMELRKKAESTGNGKYDILDPVQRPVYNQKKEILEKIATNAYIDFITGKRPISEFDAFVNEWMNAGGKAVMEEATAAYEQIK